MTTTKLFKKKIPAQTYDKDSQKPVIKASICNGEQIAGFKDLHTGKIEEVMLIKGPADLERFKKMYGIEDEIEKDLLNTAISHLEPRERRIVELRYGLTNEDGDEMTQKEVADLLGISQSYISRLEKKIMKRLKKEIVRFE